MNTEKRIYITPELVEHGTLENITKSGPDTNDVDASLVSWSDPSN